MATQAFPYLTITDGTTSCVIGDGSGGVSNYLMDALAGAWRPTIAGFSQSQLGGRGPYDDVLETMTLDVTGATAAAAAGNLQTLERLIGQAERWSRGENVSVVLIKFAPQGSTVASTAAPYQAVVTGYAPGASAACTSGDRLLMMPAAAGSMFIIPGVRCTFHRRGAWLLAITSATSAFSFANPGPFTATGMTTHPNISPCKINFAGFTANTTIDTVDSKPIVLITDNQADFQVINADAGGAGPVTFTIPAEANASRGANCLHYLPIATTEVLMTGELATANIGANARRFAIFAAVRNNSTQIYKIRVGALIRARTTGSVNEIYSYTRPVVIDASHTRPRFVPLGVVSTPAQLRSIQLAITASATGGSLDIDYVVVLAVDNPFAKAIQLDKIENTGAFSYSNANEITIDPLPLSGLAPSITRKDSTTSDTEYLGYYGDAYPLAYLTEVDAVFMCKRADQLTNWTYAPAAGAAISLTLTASRYDSRPVPE